MCSAGKAHYPTEGQALFGKATMSLRGNGVILIACWSKRPVTVTSPVSWCMLLPNLYGFVSTYSSR
jgi:hypothetical protein